MKLENDWEQYPVIHLDLSTAKNRDNPTELKAALHNILRPYKDKYGIEGNSSPGDIFSNIIHSAYERSGKQVAIILDEYDAPLLDVLHDDDMLGEYRRVMQEFYQPLKPCEPIIKFCFITGITKFSQLSIFSTLNNLTNVSMHPNFAAICGITEDELANDMKEDIADLAEYEECSWEEMHQRLKLTYDGYRFSRKSPDIYNPYSLIKAFGLQEIAYYWFDSGTPTFLIKQLQRFQTDITTMDNLLEPDTAFDVPTESLTSTLPLLYQAGYLTIKEYDKKTEMYTLSLPNKEVRVGYIRGLLPVYSGLENSEVQKGFAVKFWKALCNSNMDLAMHELQTYLAGIPYVHGFKKKLEEAATAEGFYEYTLYLIFSMLNVYVRTQVRCRGGDIDMVVLMPDTTYVLEFKTRGTAQEALDQIDNKGYALPYDTEGRKVVKVGALFSVEERSLKEWVIG